MNQSRIIVIGVFVFIIFSLLVFVTNSTFLTIKPGEAGIQFKKFSGGLDTENVYGQGFQIVAPWNSMIIYDIREQIREESMDVLSSDGLPITIDVSVRFRPQSDKIGFLHNEIGPNYGEKIVKDVTRAAAREVIGKYTPEEIYSVKRDLVKEGIQNKVREQFSKKYLLLESVNLRSIKLPQSIETAIQDKLTQEQETKKYEFRIAKERKEAERKQIEAEGIRTFQEIVGQGISADYLKWKGIEATEALANSPNAKVIVIGSGKDGLPIILGGDN